MSGMELQTTAPLAVEEVKEKFTERHAGIIHGGVAVFVFLVLWQIASMIGWVNPLFTSSPIGMFSALWRISTDGTLAPHLSISGWEFLWGFGGGVALAVPLGILIGWWRRLEMITEPFIAAFYATPYVAFLPLIILWFGIGLNSKIIIVFWTTFFPVLVNTTAGVKNINPDLIRCARSFCAPNRRILTTVALPGAVPYILTGIRLGIGRGLVGVIVAEFYVANRGLGYYIKATSANLETDATFAAILIVAVMGVLLVRGVAQIEKRFEAWSGRSGAG